MISAETNDYDKEMLAIGTYEEALDEGYLNPLNNIDINYPVEKDNFFFVTGSTRTTLGTELHEEMQKFHNAPTSENLK